MRDRTAPPLRWLPVAAVLGFLGGLLALGLGIHADYGAHWDEMNNQRFGQRWGQYVVRVATEGLSAARPTVTPLGHDQAHGPAFEVPLHFATRALGLRDSRDVILARHLLTFLTFWLGVCVFFALAHRLFGNWKPALLACALLVGHPRIFSHAFYNSVDIPFMVAFIVGTFTLLRALDVQTAGAVVAHALASAILIDIRVAGGSLVLCTLLLAAMELRRAPKTEAAAARRVARLGILYAALLPVLIVLFWPMLWSDPLRTFLEAVRASAHVRPGNSPWYYNVLWIARTTPLLHLGLFLLGLAVAMARLRREAARGQAERRDRVAILLLFFVPLVLVAFVRPKLTDAWRHHYFVYPGLVLIAMMGLTWCHETQRARLRGRGNAAAVAALGVLVALGLADPAVFMVHHHPHQDVYASGLARFLGGAQVNGARDYWGISYRRALEHILERDDGDPIPVAVLNAPGERNIEILLPSQRRRLVLAPPESARYFVTNFRFNRRVPRNGEEVYALAVDGEKFMAVYRLRE